MRTSKVLSIEEKRAMLMAELEKLDGIQSSRKIQLDDAISVMSLLPYPLILSTKEGGQGSVKKFARFGEIKKILYKDLIDIMDNHPNFLQSGYFYILSSAVIKEHGLNEIYEKLLNKEKLEELLSLNSDISVSLFESANIGQQEIILQFLVDKVKENPDGVNLNVVDKISRISKVDIVKRAESEREVTQTTN